MARIGFKKHYAAGTFDKAAILEIFNHFKAAVVDAGFTIILNTDTAIDFLRTGSPVGTANDDIQHWALSYEDLGTYCRINSYSVFGHDYMDAGAYAHNYTLVYSGWMTEPPELTAWFAADGVEGWWWLNVITVNPSSATGYEIRIIAVGASSRRYPSDMNKGLCARYGIWDNWGDWEPAYATDEFGLITVSPWTGTWSPFGEGWTNNSIRHPGSPIGKMAVPMFPNRDGGITACVLGEFREILILTDGYVSGEAPFPGWIAFTGSDRDQPFALPAPNSFTVL